MPPATPSVARELRGGDSSGPVLFWFRSFGLRQIAISDIKFEITYIKTGFLSVEGFYA
jgi:hypothetical protein